MDAQGVGGVSARQHAGGTSSIAVVVLHAI